MRFRNIIFCFFLLSSSGVFSATRVFAEHASSIYFHRLNLCLKNTGEIVARKRCHKNQVQLDTEALAALLEPLLVTEGATGPKGDQGDKGAPGDQGSVGPQGL